MIDDETRLLHSNTRTIRGFWMAFGLAATVGIFLANLDHPVRATWLATVSGLATWAATIDIREHRLPNKLVGAQTLVVTAGLVASTVASAAPLQTLFVPLLAGFGLSAIFLFLNILGTFGMGDVKFAFSMTSLLVWLGPVSTEIACYSVCVATVIASIVIIIRKRTLKTVMPYGPFLAFGLIAGIGASALVI